MDIEKLIERMNNHLQFLAAYSDPELAHTLEEASTALSTLQAENAQLRAELERVTAERDGAVEEVKHLKAVMRDKGIVVIPPKYPWEKSEWNV